VGMVEGGGATGGAGGGVGNPVWAQAQPVAASNRKSAIRIRQPWTESELAG